MKKCDQKKLDGLGIVAIRATPQNATYLFLKLLPLSSKILGLDPRTRRFLVFCTSHIGGYNSQILQDLFVL